MKRFVLFAIAFLFASLEVYSQSFAIRLSGGDQLCFQVTDSTHRKVEIVRMKTFGNIRPSLPEGELVIPSTIKYKDTTYYVMSIGEAAFAGAEGLTSVSIPSSVRRIDDRAFSGCSRLNSVVFPSCKPSFGENVFEKCDSISRLSFGSDWTVVNLQMFADAVSLKEVSIPARVTKLTGVKSLKRLERIEVDPNNQAFSSHDGMLYSKDGKTFYACPNARTGQVTVQEGTEKILDGAFGSCEKVESLILPSSIREFAYDEFADCAGLSRIIMMSEIPPMTAKWDGSAVFAVVAPNSQCTILVPKKTLSRYQTNICSAEGEYESMQGNRKAAFGPDRMMSKTTVKKIK